MYRREPQGDMHSRDRSLTRSSDLDAISDPNETGSHDETTDSGGVM